MNNRFNLFAYFSLFSFIFTGYVFAKDARFSKTPEEYLRFYHSILYNPLESGMKDLTVEAKIPEFHDTLLKQRLITKPTKLRVKMYWQKPNKRDSKVLGLTGYTNLEMGLKQSFDRKFDLFVPGQIKRLTKGYQLKNFNVKDGIEYIEATDPTGKKIVQRYLFGFDKKGLLKKMKVYRPTGIENRIFTYERRKDASNRYVLKTLEVTVLGAGFRTITTHQVAYEKTSGFVLPSKLETSTRLVHTAKKSKSREKVITESTIFDDYMINKGKAKEYLSSNKIDQADP